MSERGALIAGRYRLVNQLGSGGMGIVWEAWDERLRRPVALKELHPQLGLSEAQAELANSRAMREARITARLHHPHAVPVFDVVEQDGQPCLIMQYLPSRSLHTILDEKGRLTPTEVGRIGAEVASALAAAHRVGIVHRDVKPGNVLITEDGSAKISDFGISHALGDVTLTSTGMVTGTPAYLAPEVAQGAESTFASDVFSLGATLYAAVEGVPPFGTHENPMALLHLVASGRVTPPTRGGGLTPLLTRMLAAAPQDRPPMDQVARELQALDGAPSATVEDDLPLAAAAATTQVMESPVHLGKPTATALSPAGEPPTGPPPTRPGAPTMTPRGVGPAWGWPSSPLPSSSSSQSSWVSSCSGAATTQAPPLSRAPPDRARRPRRAHPRRPPARRPRPPHPRHPARRRRRRRRASRLLLHRRRPLQVRPRRRAPPRRRPPPVRRRRRAPPLPRPRSRVRPPVPSSRRRSRTTTGPCRATPTRGGPG